MQANFAGLTKDQMAINRIRFVAEGGRPLKLAYSGGKDSDTLLHLAKRAEVPFRAVYNWTTVDPPELLDYIKREHPEVEIVKPKKTMWELVEEHQLLPLRTKRYCCEDLKEQTNESGIILLTGIRWAESRYRKTRAWLELSYRDKSIIICNPIIDWSTVEVWGYLREHKIPYCSLYDEGFHRLGCVLCPMETANSAKLSARRWPKIALAWRHAADRVIANRKDKNFFKTGEEYFHWWLSRRGTRSDAQCVMFQ